MAEVIKLTDKYIDASNVYDSSQSRTVNDILSYRLTPGARRSGWDDRWDNYKSLMEYCRHTSGLYGSAYMQNALDGIASTWYWYLFIPHRIGSDIIDNSDYGVLFMTPFWATSIYMIKYSNANYTVRTI